MSCQTCQGETRTDRETGYQERFCSEDCATAETRAYRVTATVRGVKAPPYAAYLTVEWTVEASGLAAARSAVLNALTDAGMVCGTIQNLEAVD